ncbi:Secreted RxLR effector peptide protein [Phytophthora palmivora]|uniref:RxLR effector protein n=1 Tax=Phytophthora palmivora TaxID=4796 RepID=A0A2P4YFK6_9STRA|nr:Secreted RxLR effector peptide protein [Phytophthora palmivora]
MRLTYILMAAVLTLSVHQVPVTAFVGSDDAPTALVSPEFLHRVGADRSVSDQSRFLRGNNFADSDKEERAFADVVDQLMAKAFVKKIVRTESFSTLGKVNGLARLKRIEDEADNFLLSVFKFSDDAKMSPSALAKHLKTFPELDDKFKEKAVVMYADYLKGLGKAHSERLIRAHNE